MDPRTATRGRSIWEITKEHDFRKQLVILADICNQVPREPVTYRPAPVQLQDRLFMLELTLAQGFAFIAAADEGVDTVSAVCIIGIQSLESFVVRLAANAGVNDTVIQYIDKILELLSSCAKRAQRKKEVQAQVFEQVLTLNKDRIYARLRSRLWKVPNYLRGAKDQELPLWKHLLDVCEKMAAENAKPNAVALERHLRNLVKNFKDLEEESPQSDEIKILYLITEQCYLFCTSNGQMSFAKTLEMAGKSKLIENRHIRQLEKIAMYFYFTKTFVSASKKYPEKFKSATAQYLSHYDATRSEVSGKGTAVSCHVHAEIQLLIFNDLETNPSQSSPRVIGTSKATCFLCAHTIHHHGIYFVERTHSRIFDQWTLPDLKQYNDKQIAKYRNIIAEIHKEVRRLSGRKLPLRKFPLTSWLDVTGQPPFSPCLSSQTVSVKSEAIVASVAQMGPARSEGSKDNSNITHIEAPQLVLSTASVVENVQSMQSAGGKTDLSRASELLGQVHIMSQSITEGKDLLEIFEDLEAGLGLDISMISEPDFAVRFEKGSKHIDLEDFHAGQELIIDHDWESDNEFLLLLSILQDGKSSERKYWELVLRREIGSVNSARNLQEANIHA